MGRFLYGLCVGVLLWLSANCRAADDAPPPNLISTEKMADILTDVHLNEVRISRLSLGSSDSATLVYTYLQQQLMQKYELDTATYHASYTYYALHPDKMEDIYKQVVGNLQKKAGMPPDSTAVKP